MGKLLPEALPHGSGQGGAQAAAARAAGACQGQGRGSPVGAAPGNHQQPPPLVFAGRWGAGGPLVQVAGLLWGTGLVVFGAEGQGLVGG